MVHDVWAVGESSARGALILHFDGTSWSVVPNDPPIADSALLAVVPVGPQDVWAVGYAGDGTLTERWDGSTWSVVTSPNGVQPSSVLSDLIS